MTEVEGDFQIYRGGVIYHRVHFSNFFPTGDANERSPGWISGYLDRVWMSLNNYRQMRHRLLYTRTPNSEIR